MRENGYLWIFFSKNLVCHSICSGFFLYLYTSLVFLNFLLIALHFFLIRSSIFNLLCCYCKWDLFSTYCWLIAYVIKAIVFCILILYHTTLLNFFFFFLRLAPGLTTVANLFFFSALSPQIPAAHSCIS